MVTTLYKKLKVSDVDLGKSKLEIRKIKGRMWELVSPFKFTIYFKNKTKLVVVVPKGFKTNLTSFPIFGVTGSYDRAAVCHDYLYTIQILTQHASDKVFLIAMEKCGVGFFIRRLFHSTVWLFGFRNWAKATKLLKKGKI